MSEALLCYVALPCTPRVQGILNFLSITYVQHRSDIKFTRGGGLFIYNSTLKLEKIDHETEWVINDEDVLPVLVLFANNDFKGICEYLNNIPERPFDVYINSVYLTNRLIL